MFRKILIGIGLLIAANGLIAQTGEVKPLRLGIGMLGSAYIGDLNNNGEELYRFYPGMGISMQFVNNKVIAPQFNGGFGRFVSQDRDIAAVEGVQPNTFVSTSYFFVDLRIKARFMKDRLFNPFVSAGIGLLGYTPKDMDGNSLIDNVATRNPGELYGSMTFGAPLSAGFEWHFNNVMGIGLEYSYRLTGSDYLDNVGQLGTRAGKDKLQTLMLSLYLTIDPENPFDIKLRGRY